jgi:hypothetical protein
MDEPKTILPELAILFQARSVVAVGGTEGAGVGGLSVRQAVASIPTSKSTNNTGLAFIISLLFDESLYRKKDWKIGDE